MCIIVPEVEALGNTRIFARSLPHAQQALIYEMEWHASSSATMILPIPVIPGSAEDSVHFFDLTDAPDLFNTLEANIESPTMITLGGAAFAEFEEPPLAIVDVGSFEASFSPTMKDLDRLDQRFQLDPEIWQALPQYSDYGFAIFKLKSGAGRIGRTLTDSHPMAFTFPTRSPDKLFFPTVHIHDGALHQEADFDHNLFCQCTLDQLDRLENINAEHGFIRPKIDSTQQHAVPGSETDIEPYIVNDFMDHAIMPEPIWYRSPLTLENFLDTTCCSALETLFEKSRRVFRRRIQGTLQNQDIWL